MNKWLTQPSLYFLDTIQSLCYRSQTCRFYYKYNCHSKFTFFLLTNYNLQCGAHLSYNGVGLYWISFLSKQQRYCVTTFKLTQIHHFPLKKLLLPTKFFEIYIVISLLKLPSFVCYKRLGCLMHSHIKRNSNHTHIRKPMSSGWSSSFQVSCHTHTHSIVFFLILLTLKV